MTVAFDFLNYVAKKRDKRVKILYWITKDKKIVKYSPYAFPIDLFMLLPHMSFNFITSKVATPNTYITSVLQPSMPLISAYLKNLIWIGSYHLIERTTWENIKPDLCTNYTDLLFFSKWNASIRLLLLSNTNKFESVSSIYYNAIWLEREISELFDLNISNLRDTRKLLLEYSSRRGALNKNLTIHRQHRYSSNIKTNLVTTN
jgi:hypothetical protein